MKSLRLLTALCGWVLWQTSALAQTSLQLNPAQPPLLTIQGSTLNQRLAIDVMSKIQNGLTAQQEVPTSPSEGLKISVQDSCVGNWNILWTGNTTPVMVELSVDWPPTAPKESVKVERPLTPIANGVTLGPNVLLTNEARTGAVIVPSRGITINVTLKNTTGEVLKTDSVRSACRVQF
jgi:hypothetical protein